MSATESDPDRGPAWPASGVVSPPGVVWPAVADSASAADLPCAASLAVLTAVDPTLIPAADRLELLVELERHAAWLESVRLSVVAAVAGPGPDFSQVDARLVDPGEPLWDVQMAQDTIRDEIAVALRVSGRAADRRIGLARDLEHKLPATRHLLRAGKDGGKPDFFGPAPADAKFVSTRVVLDDDGDEAKVTGNLTLNGVTKPVTLDVDFHGAGTNPYNKKATVGFNAETTIRRESGSRRNKSTALLS